MSRRSGQNGYIEKKGNAYYVRFWCDVVGQERRAHKSVRICPATGPGKLNQSQREHRAKEIIAESGADTAEHFHAVHAVNLGVTFQQQAEVWMRDACTRKSDPVKPATITSWRSHLKFINAHIGAVPAADVNNKVLKQLVAEMAKAGFTPKTQQNYAKVVKQVVASAVNDDGEPLYPRTWNHKFADLPSVNHKQQHTPALTADEVSKLLAKAADPYRVLYALLAASGLRIGEALGLEVSDVSLDGQTITVRQSVWNGDTQQPKTLNAYRQVDLHLSIAAMLLAHIGNRESGFLFQTDKGTPLGQSNVLRRSLHPLLASMGAEKMGFHSFRRFRTTHLRRHAPENLVRYWLGHSNKNVTDLYDKTHEDVAYRRSVANKIPLGFALVAENPSGTTDIVPICTQSSFLVSAASA